jgi:cell division protein FtsI/penicillin-binding protein 2
MAREGHWTHAWFVGFAPARNPQVAVVVFLERGQGGLDAAPLARKILQAWQQSQSQGAKRP